MLCNLDLVGIVGIVGGVVVFGERVFGHVLVCGDGTGLWMTMMKG
jgi:hypothetical protein